MAALLVPALLFGVVAWLDRAVVLKGAEKDVLRTVAIFEQHARTVFETHRLVAARINERIRAMTWAEIARSDELHQDLATIPQQYPQVQSIWLIDPDGIVRNSSLALPSSRIVAADRDFFVALREANLDTFVGRPIIGRLNGFVNFNVAQRRIGQLKTFDGVIAVSIRPTYFANFWKRIAPNLDPVTSLIRADGTILAREPDSERSTLGTDSPLMRAIGQSDSGEYRAVSPIDGVDRLFAYRKIDAFPVYVAHGKAVEAALGLWHRHVLVYGVFFGLATLGLALMATAAMQSARREAAALHHWRATACQLTEETARRSAIEEQLHQSQKMEALGQMTGGVSHDFGNILTIVIGNLELLRLRTIEPHSVELIEGALRGAARGAKAIEALLAFARRQPLRSQIFDANEVLLSMTEMIKQALGPNIGLDMALTADAWPVEADPNQTNLAVLNLVVNARDAMREGGILRIETANVMLNKEADNLVGEFVAVTVSDTGIGMAAPVLSRVFEPFFTTKEPGQGTGLGLSMVYGFARQSRGSVTIESVVGKGTTIILYLPRGMPEDTTAIEHERQLLA